MTNTALALKAIINQNFDANQRDFSRSAKISGALVTKLLQGGTMTPKTLKTITSALSTDDAASLAMAAIRDYLPPEITEELFQPGATGLLSEPSERFNALDPKTEEIFAKLRALVRKDPETRDWLHHLATWIFPNSNQD